MLFRSVMFGKREPVTDESIYPELELVRLAIPRRVYTNQHLTSVAEALIDLHHRRDSIGGLVMAYEAPRLRHFTARFETETPAGILCPSVGFVASPFS